MNPDLQPFPLSGAARVAVWIALGGTSWAVLGAAVLVAVRLIG